MDSPTSTDPRLAKQVAVLDLVRNGASITEAADAASISRRSIHLWAEKDAAFGTALRDAQKNRGRVVTEGQLDTWRAQLGAQEDRAAQIEADLLEVAAPALAGDEASLAHQCELRIQLTETRELIAGLKVAVESAELHIQRARQAEAEAARAAAAAEAAGLAEQQRAAAERIDAALRELEAGWADFDAASKQRQAVARRAGAQARPAYVRMLVQAVFACAPGAATALSLDRQLRPRSRPLSETIG